MARPHSPAERLRDAEYRKKNRDTILAKNRLRYRSDDLKKKYGITEQDYNDMLYAQDCCCAICGHSPDERLVVDHDHSTGLIRGLLCDPCNLMLGQANDDQQKLINGAAYLSNSQTSQTICNN